MKKYICAALVASFGFNLSNASNHSSDYYLVLKEPFFEKVKNKEQFDMEFLQKISTNVVFFQESKCIGNLKKEFYKILLSIRSVDFERLYEQCYDNFFKIRSIFNPLFMTFWGAYKCDELDKFDLNSFYESFQVSGLLNSETFCELSKVLFEILNNAYSNRQLCQWFSEQFYEKVNDQCFDAFIKILFPKQMKLFNNAFNAFELYLCSWYLPGKSNDQILDIQDFVNFSSATNFKRNPPPPFIKRNQFLASILLPSPSIEPQFISGVLKEKFNTLLIQKSSFLLECKSQLDEFDSWKFENVLSDFTRRQVNEFLKSSMLYLFQYDDLKKMILDSSVVFSNIINELLSYDYLKNAESDQIIEEYKLVLSETLLNLEKMNNSIKLQMMGSGGYMTDSPIDSFFFGQPMFFVFKALGNSFQKIEQKTKGLRELIDRRNYSKFSCYTDNMKFNVLRSHIYFFRKFCQECSSVSKSVNNNELLKSFFLSEFFKYNDPLSQIFFNIIKQFGVCDNAIVRINECFDYIADELSRRLDIIVDNISLLQQDCQEMSAIQENDDIVLCHFKDSCCKYFTSDSGFFPVWDFLANSQLTNECENLFFHMCFLYFSEQLLSTHIANFEELNEFRDFFAGVDSRGPRNKFEEVVKLFKFYLSLQ